MDFEFRVDLVVQENPRLVISQRVNSGTCELLLLQVGHQVELILNTLESLLNIPHVSTLLTDQAAEAVLE